MDNGLAARRAFMEGLLLIHAAATWALAGLIWTIQAVHYPLFARVGADGYRVFQQEHMSRITPLVGPLMVTEAAAAAILLVAALRGALDGPAPAAVAGFVLLVLIWISTAAWQAPLHGRLAQGFDAALHRRLVRTNWARTVLWTARAVLAAGLLL